MDSRKVFNAKHTWCCRVITQWLTSSRSTGTLVKNDSNRRVTNTIVCYLTLTGEMQIRISDFLETNTVWFYLYTLFFKGLAGLKQTKSELLNGNQRQQWGLVGHGVCSPDAPSGLFLFTLAQLNLNSFQLWMIPVTLCATLLKMGNSYTCYFHLWY